jgi:hypothetical protein
MNDRALTPLEQELARALARALVSEVQQEERNADEPMGLGMLKGSSAQDAWGNTQTGISLHRKARGVNEPVEVPGLVGVDVPEVAG